MHPETETLERGPVAVEPVAPPCVRVAIVCPGPSLCDFPGSDGFSSVIAVNRAAKAVRVDYWVCLDHHTFGDAWGGGTKTEQQKRDPLKPVGRPTLICSLSTFRRIGRRCPAVKRWKHENHQQLKFPKKKVRWHRWGWATAILWAAIKLEATEIECWGMDWVGQGDFDGFEHGKMRRDERRWAAERAQFGRLAAWWEGKGVRVTRHPRSEAMG